MSANDKQVGGQHYAQRDKPQHWDLVQMYGWDYFQGQITKYLMRWKYKHKTPEARLEDLKKARHFLDKYIEIAEQAEPDAPEPKLESTYGLPFEQYEKNSSRYMGDSVFLCEGGWGDGNNLYKCQACRELIVSPGLVEARQMHTVCLPLTPAQRHGLDG